MRTDVERLLDMAARERLYWLRENAERRNHGPQQTTLLTEDWFA